MVSIPSWRSNALRERCSAVAMALASAGGSPVPRRLERLLEVGDKVLGILDAHREAQSAGSDAAPPAFFGRDGGVRHRLRVADKRLHATEALGEREQSQGAHEVVDLPMPTRQGERHHPPMAAHLAPGEIALRVGRQAWVHDVVYSWVLRQECGHASAVLGVTLHADCLLYTSPSPRD